MKSDLGSDFNVFLESYENENVTALRLNPLKADENVALPFPTDGKVRWSRYGYYYDETVVKPGAHPYHHAGVYYIQDASAQGPVELLAPKPGEKVLDLCAAPGGKSTQIAGYLEGKGLLVSNEPIKNRAKILSENIERMGMKNAVVVSEFPDKLASKWQGFFDAIMVDAPCSGEGMFRKNPEAISEWSPENVKMCAERQLEILESAVIMLAANGRICYSTCTFSKDEDEELVAKFLELHPDFRMVKEERLWPHIDRCEGHYMALLARGEYAVSGAEDLPESGQSADKNAETDDCITVDYAVKDSRHKADIPEYLKDIVSDSVSVAFDDIIKIGDIYFALPKGMPDTKGIHVLRAGLCLGEEKKGRFEPAHALAMSLKPSEVLRVINLNIDEASAYLKGMTINTDVDKGWALVCVDGYSLGWAKVSGGVGKNHYPKGLRMMG